MSQSTITAAPKYVAVALPANFIPSAMMRDGQIPGTSGRFAAVYRSGAIRLLGTFTDENSTALYVNPLGHAVGYSYRPPLATASSFRALLFENGQIRDLGHLPDASGTLPANRHVVNAAQVIGDGDQIYGYSSFPANLGGSPLVRFSPGASPVRMSNVSGLNAAGNIANINEHGALPMQLVVGSPIGPYAASSNGVTSALLFGQRASSASWINDLGDVAGYMDPVNEAENDANHWTAFVRTGTGSLKLLPSLPGSNSMQSSGINDRGDVVGTSSCSYPATCSDAAFLYTGGRLYNVKNLVPNAFASPSDALPGISEHGAFLVRTSTRYYIVQPSTWGS